MATLTDVLGKLVAMGSQTLRDRIVIAKYCNKDFSPVPIPFGSAISVAIPSAITAVAVTPANTPPATTAIAPTSVAVTCDQWYEAPFELSDKDLLQCDRGIMPMQAKEAIKAMANAIEDYLFGLATGTTGIYGYAGTAGTTPFATDLTAFTAADKVLNDQLCPMEDRFFVMNTAARANALNLTQVTNAAFRGDNRAITSGEMGNVLGANWQYSTRVPSHVAGGSSHWQTNGAPTVGDTTIAVETDGGAVAHMHVGDIITFAGDTQTYTVTARTGGDAHTAITIRPGIKVAVGDHALITAKASHVVNILAHRDCFAFASAPLMDSAIAPGLVHSESIVDPNSGIALRLEVTREHKRLRFSYDALWGGAIPRPELGCRLAG